MKYFIILIYVVHYSWAADKNWNNYQPNNLRNWNNEISVNGLFFSSNIENPMAFYSHEEDFCQVIIPMNSDDNDTNFAWTPVTLNSGKQVACPDQENGNTYWIDPRNWDSLKTSKATPHLERLPCTYDSVELKQMKELYVILPKTPVAVRQFWWNGKTVHRYNFNVLMRTEEFIKNFIVTGSKDVWEMILITSNSCANQTGCECGTYQFYKETCKLLRKECNTTALACLHPVKPNNHCCQICGCYMHITFDRDSFVYNKLTTVVKKFFNKKKNLDFHVSKQSENLVQIVIVYSEKTDDHDELYNAVNKLRTLLQSDDASLSHLSSSILDVNIFCSWNSDSNSNDSLYAVSHVIAPLFAIVSLVILAVLLFQSKISLSKLQDIFKSSLSFVKFENQFEKDEDDHKQSQSQQQQQQQEQQIGINKEESPKTEPELRSEGKSENGTSSEPDDDTVLVELS